MHKDRYRLHPAAMQRFVLGTLTIVLAACGGGGNLDPGPGDTVAFREYALPASSSTYEYDEYNLGTDGTASFLERNVWLYTVTPGQITLTTDNSDSHVAIDASRLIFDPGSEYEFAMPRSVKQGDVFQDAGGQQFALFGPYKNSIFTLYGSTVQRQDDSVLIEIYRRDQDEFSDIYVRYYARGIGVVGLNRYELCPLNTALDINLDYSEICERSFPDQILVAPE